MRPLNRSSFTIQKITLPVLAESVNLPYMEIPNGFAAVIRAHPDNTGLVYIANSSENIIDPLKRSTLRANDVIQLHIINTALVYAAGSIEGQTVELIAET